MFDRFMCIQIHEQVHISIIFLKTICTVRACVLGNKGDVSIRDVANNNDSF